VKRARAGARGYRLDEQIGFRLRLAMQRHTDLFFKNMVLGLTQPQFAALARLYLSGPCSQNLLGRSISLDSASIVGVISRLRARRFVGISKAPGDKRRRVISLTPEGHAAVKAAIVRGVIANEQTLAPLSEEERQELIELLRKLAPGDEPAAGPDR
jgi:MarR family transcriptional regulator, lower aerobic nicotinate degradation pathway regulator